MNEHIFRKKSLERIKSPEDLDDYVRIAGPGVWLLLGAVVLLLIGALIWGICGRVETSYEASASVKDGAAVVTVAGEIPALNDGSFVRIEGNEYPASEKDGVLSCVTALPDGEYASTLVTESTKPISFIWN